MKTFLTLLCLIFLSTPVLSQSQDIEQKFYDMTRHLRCLTCDGQSIHESNSIFAENIKNLVLERLKQGQSQEQIEDFLRDRYGDAIVMTPPATGGHIILWLAPFVFAFIVLISLYGFYKPGKKKP